MHLRPGCVSRLLLRRRIAPGHPSLSHPPRKGFTGGRMPARAPRSRLASRAGPVPSLVARLLDRFLGLTACRDSVVAAVVARAPSL